MDTPDEFILGIAREKMLIEAMTNVELLEEVLDEAEFPEWGVGKDFVWFYEMGATQTTIRLA